MPTKTSLIIDDSGNVRVRAATFTPPPPPMDGPGGTIYPGMGMPGAALELLPVDAVALAEQLLETVGTANRVQAVLDEAAEAAGEAGA